MTSDRYDEQVQPPAAALSFGFTKSSDREPDDHSGMFPPGKEVQMVNTRVRAQVKWVISDGQKVKCREQSSGNS